MENFPIQGNDPRANGEKPKTTWQRAYPITMADGKEARILEVHVNDDPFSPVYFRGIPEMYKGGAVYRENLAADFVGDPVEAVEPTPEASVE
jgi:hypothetical protein